MGRIFDDASPKEEERIIDERRRENFVRAGRFPTLLGMLADRHMRAADYLFEIACGAEQRNLDRFRARVKAGINGRHELVGPELQDHRDSELLSEYFILAGYAVECITKGILLLRHPEFVVDEHHLDRRIRTHDLPTLCAKCGIELSDDERNLLSVVTRHVEWGKYPAPTTYDKMPTYVDPEDDRLKDLSVGNPFHERRVQVLIQAVYGRAAALFVSLRTEWRERQ